MTRERRLTLLTVALVVAGGYFLWTRGSGLLDAGGGGGFARSGGQRSVVGAEIVDLDSEALEQRPGTYRPGRDLFRYQRPAPSRTQTPKPPPRRPPPRPPAETQEVVAAGPKPPPVDLVYLGSFGRSERRIAVFADEESIYNAMVGDVLKEAFRLVAIGFESADVEFVGFPDVSAERLAVGGS